MRPGEEASDDRTVSLRCGHCDQILLTVGRKPSSGKLETVWVECPDCGQWNELEKPAPDKADGQYTRSIPTDWTFTDNPPS